jgi:hypothetical protein
MAAEISRSAARRFTRTLNFANIFAPFGKIDADNRRAAKKA